jgi:murein DD-endopeptidase MepM/ murein hydrolase activator NlpD
VVAETEQPSTVGSTANPAPLATTSTVATTPQSATVATEVAAVPTAVDTTTPATSTVPTTEELSLSNDRPVSSEPPTTRTPYVVPLADPSSAGWGEGHAGYPATDVFAPCGAELVSPVNGVITEVRSVDSWDPNVDNPATRGGRSVTIVGDDGVRFYLAHLEEVDPVLAPQNRVAVGQRLGTVGLTGRTSGCHVHFGISPPCPGKEWSIRRGAIPPAPYLDAWRQGRQISPGEDVDRWTRENPDACAVAMTDPNAADA